MWDCSIRNMLILCINEQSIIVAMNGGIYVDWILTVVYVPRDANVGRNCGSILNR